MIMDGGRCKTCVFDRSIRDVDNLDNATQLHTLYFKPIGFYPPMEHPTEEEATMRAIILGAPRPERSSSALPPSAYCR